MGSPRDCTDGGKVNAVSIVEADATTSDIIILDV